jgi:hypothetical protein
MAEMNSAANIPPKTAMVTILRKRELMRQE